MVSNGATLAPQQPTHNFQEVPALCSKTFNLQLQKIYTRKSPPKIIFTKQQKQESFLCPQLANKLSQMVILKLIII